MAHIGAMHQTSATECLEDRLLGQLSTGHQNADYQAHVFFNNQHPVDSAIFSILIACTREMRDALGRWDQIGLYR